MALSDLNAAMNAPLKGRRFAKMRQGQGIKDSPELQRILALPRASEVDYTWIGKGLRRKQGMQELRPDQGRALYYAADGGLAAPMQVGAGKTLVTLLLAELLGLERVVLLVPKALIEKTKRDYVEYLKHWRVRMPRIVGYELLSSKNSVRLLYDLRPQMIIADEAHKLKSLKAACTRRVFRYRQDMGCIFIPLSGSMMSNVTKSHHLFDWALDDKSPLPREQEVAEDWDTALDPRCPAGKRSDYGHLRAFLDPEDDGNVPVAYRRWVNESPGVVSVAGRGCNASIIASKWKPELPEKLVELMNLVEVAKRRPTDNEILDPSEVAMTLSQLSVGCCYRWYPLPPEYWLAARREWVIFCNDFLETPQAYDMHIDTPKQVAELFPDRWEKWLEIKKTFTPNTVVDWIDDAPLKRAVEWAKKGNIPGIVWSRWRAVGQRLQELGLPHHADKGYDANGVHINDARGPVSASISTCGTGCNLQQYRRNLVLTLPSDLEIWEQFMGRTHRSGQEADEVFFDIYHACDYHARTLRRALDAAKRDPANPKLALATWAN